MTKPQEPIRRSVRRHAPPARHRQDCEFLPAALEILETPASPVRTAFIWFICILATAALLWGWFGRFDIVATAQGKVQPAGRVKIIESLESGRAKSVPVKNGTVVRAGDIVVELDDTEIKADEAAKLGNLNALKAEVICRDTLLGTLAGWKKQDIWKQPKASAIKMLPVPTDIPEAVRGREQAVFEADLRGIVASLDSLAAQRKQRQTEIDGLTEAIAAQKKLVDTLEERVTMRSKLVQSNAGSRAQVIDAMQEHQEAAAALADKLAQLKTAEAAFGVATAEGVKLLETVAADNAARKLEAERGIDELEQEVIKARKRRELMTIKSPIDGIIQLSSITTTGQVVASGTELMRIVPVDATLEIEAYLPNKDIGFVSAGQPAIIKVEAYPFTRFGILEGHVAHISLDAIPEPDAQQLETTVAQQVRSTIPTGNVPRVQNLVFPVTIGFDTTTLEVEGRPMPVTPGMGVTVEIKTGQRRILEYLFSPLVKVTSEAMKER